MIAPSAPVLTEKTSPGPGVEIYFASLDGDGETITVWRIADGVREEVRGAKRAPVSGDFVVTDWEVPFGVVSTYVADLFDSGGASVSSGQAAITVVSDDVNFMNPIDPEQQFPAVLQASSLQGAVQGSNNQQVYVMGIPRPFNQFWGAGALQSVPLEVWSRSDAETQNMRSLTTAGQWLIRTPPSYNFLPRLLYVSVRSMPFYPMEMWNAENILQWQLTVDEVQPVSKAVLRPLVTWDDWQAAYPAVSATWADVIADYGTGTWTDAIRNPPVA